LETIESRWGGEKGRRRIDLPHLAIDALHDHRRRMLVEGRDVKDAVFCSPEGGLSRKSNFLRRCYYPLLKQAGLPRIRFHDLRHTAATLLLMQGEHSKVVQERLGRSRSEVNTFSHVLPTMQQEAAARLDRLFG
jgi:integrase